MLGLSLDDSSSMNTAAARPLPWCVARARVCLRSSSSVYVLSRNMVLWLSFVTVVCSSSRALFGPQNQPCYGQLGNRDWPQCVDSRIGRPGTAIDCFANQSDQEMRPLGGFVDLASLGHPGAQFDFGKVAGRDALPGRAIAS